MADLGVGVHIEVSYPHPCVVIYNGWNVLLVVPVTHDHRKVEAEDNDKMPKLTIPSTFNGEKGIYKVEGLRAISKQRILDERGSIGASPEFEEIRKMILENYLPTYYEELSKLRERVPQLEADLEETRKRVAELEAERAAFEEARDASATEAAFSEDVQSK